MADQLHDRRAEVLADLGVTTSSTFAWSGLDRVGDRLVLHWELDGVGPLTEQWQFHGLAMTSPDPAVDDAIAAASRMLHLLAGVSYLKATLPPRLHTGPLSHAMHALMTSVLADGLAEFAWCNDIDLDDHFELPSPTPSAGPAGAIGATRGPLVPVGGGKDSIVSLDAVRHLDPTLFAVNPRGPITRTLDVADLPATTVTRRLDPILFDLNERGAFNGHVPITAIISAGAMVAAVAGGHRGVLLSNERSADQATVVTDDGRQVNHQWSKASVFEHAFAAIVADEVAPDVAYLSLLRPLSELAIGQRFTTARTPTGATWDATFNSCNRAFHLRGQRREWCGECPKCRFVFLALAPSMGRERVTAIFGRSLVADPLQIEHFADLAGIGDHKPFECVGEEEESAAVLAWLATRPEWEQDAVLVALRERLPVDETALHHHLAAPDLDALAQPWAAALADQDTGDLPDGVQRSPT